MNKIIIALLIFPTFLVAQTFPSITFDNFSPKWIHFVNGNIENDSTLGYQSEKTYFD